MLGWRDREVTRNVGKGWVEVEEEGVGWEEERR